MGWGFGFVFEEIREPRGCEGFGFGREQRSSGGVDVLEGSDGLLIGFRLKDCRELGEFEGMELAELEGGDRGIEEVFEEFAGQLWLIGICHAGIFAGRLGGTRGKWTSAGSLRTGRGVGGGFWVGAKCMGLLYTGWQPAAECGGAPPVEIKTWRQRHPSTTNALRR